MHFDWCWMGLPFYVWKPATLLLSLQSLCTTGLKLIWLISLRFAPLRRGQASGAQVVMKVAAVLQEDDCPSLCSFYFIVRRFGPGNAFQNCYITAVTGTDVDLSSVWFKERVWVWRDREAGEIAHWAFKWKHYLRCSCKFKGAVQSVERQKSYFVRGSQERAARMLGGVCFIRKWMSVFLNERESIMKEAWQKMLLPFDELKTEPNAVWVRVKVFSLVRRMSF